MEPIKKRRNSILKKKPTEEDTTTEIKARRISFSGKKSVKEFIAGEEAETIWGTSYEESADDLKVSSSESGLVNVHVKRIQLRNRRVVCEPQQQQQKRRSSSKKKVFIAENDKENLCVKPKPQPVEIAPETKPTTTPTVRDEETQSKSPVKSELPVVKCQEIVPFSRETMPKKSDIVDCSSICSSTFDFINFSGQISKIITTDHSWDVSLNESELKMFKFRAPVTATDISPNASNILCRSIMMTEDDVNIVKTIRKQKRTVDIVKEQITDDELNLIETMDGNAEVIDMSKMNIEETIIVKSHEMHREIASNSMEISKIHEGKGSKRKSERTPHSIVVGCSLVEINSPLRKKAMHTLNSSSMDATNNANENCPQKEPNARTTIYESIAVDESLYTLNTGPSRRPTIHYESVAVEESVMGVNTISEANTLSQTVFDSKTINESTSFPNTTASCLAMGNQIDISMELSICAPEVKENKETNWQTIHFLPNIQMDHTLVGDQPTPHVAIPKISQTIYESSDVEEITVPTNQVIKPRKKQRVSIYNSTDMDEESPKSIKSLNAINPKGLKLRHTIYTPEEIEPEKIDSKLVLQETVITPINIFEDSIQAEPKFKGVKKDHQNIYDSVEMKENIVPIQPPKYKETRASIYTPTDMIEDSPKPKDAKTISTITVQESIFRSEDIDDDIPRDPASKSYVERTINKSVHNFEEPQERDMASNPTNNNRQTIFEQIDINEDSVFLQSAVSHHEKNNGRKSIYTPINMIDDSPKCIEFSQPKRAVSSSDLKTRKTIFNPEDIIEDNPRNLPSKSVLQKTIKTPIDIFEDSLEEEAASKPTVRKRPSIFESVDIEEDLEATRSFVHHNKINKARESIYTPSDIIQDSPKSSLPSQTVIEENPKHLKSESLPQRTMKTILKSTDIAEDSEPLPSSVALSKINMARQSIYNPTDMIEDSPKCNKPSHLQYKRTPSLVDPKIQHADIEGDLQAADSDDQQVFSKASGKRQTILMSQDLEITIPSEEKSILPPRSLKDEQRSLNNEQCTIYFRDELETEDKNNTNEHLVNKQQMYPDEETKKNVKEYAYSVNNKLESLNTHNRQTIYFTNNNSLDETINVSSSNIQMDNPLIAVQADKVSKTMATNKFVNEKSSRSNLLEVAVSKSYKSRKSVYSPSDMLEESAKNVENQNTHTLKSLKTRQTIFTPEDIMDDSIKDIRSEEVLQNTADDNQQPKKQRGPSKIQVFRRQSSAPDLTSKKCLQENVGSGAHCSSKTPKFSFAVYQANLKKRQSIHTPVDMVEDSPDHKKQIHLSQPNVELRKTVYESCDIMTASPIASTVEKNHQQTINNQVDIVTDCPVTTTKKSLQKNYRQTIHTPLEMMEDSPQLKIDAKEKLARTNENKIIVQEKDINLQKGNDLPFRKPTKLFSEALKTSENPYSSTKSLMDKVMQEMGYSMNFQLECPPEVTSHKLSQSKGMYSHKDFDPSMLLSDSHDVPAYNTMQLSISREPISNKFERHTMHLSEDMEVNFENDDDIHCKASPLKNNAQTNEQEKLDYQQSFGSLNLLKKDNKKQLSHETKCNKSSSQAMLAVDSSKRELESHKLKAFEEEARSGKTITANTMDMSIAETHNSLHQTKQLHNSKKSEYDQHTFQNIDKQSETCSFHNVDIQDDGDEERISKAPSKRQTIHFNQDLDVEDIDEYEKSSINNKAQDMQVQESAYKAPSSQTLLINQDLHIEDDDDQRGSIAQVPEPQVYNKVGRKTTHCYEDLEEEENFQEVSGKSIDRIELKKENGSPKQLRRKTVYLNDDLELDDRQETSLKGPLKSSKNFNRLTMHLNEKIEDIETMKNKPKPLEVKKQQKRQTIFMNEDLDLSEIEHFKKNPPQVFSEGSSRSDRRTIHLNQDIDVNDGQKNSSEVIQQKHNRLTVHYNQELDTDDQQFFRPQCYKTGKRQTILMSQELDMTIPSGEQSVIQPRSAKDEQSCQQNEQHTLYFEESGQQIFSDDENVKQKKVLDQTERNTKENAYSVHNKLESLCTQNRRTIYFAHNNSLDESVQAARDDNKMNSSIAKTNRFKEQEDFSTKILSKPRHVTICDIQTLDMEESPKPTARKSSFSRTLNFDEASTMKTVSSQKKLTSIVKPRVTWQSTSKDDESPVFNPSLRSKCPMTPSEVDRSLAEYLKVEAAIEDQEEEIFYDAEDGTENEKQTKRHTCHVPVDILEESGMQPLQSYSLKRQTTFSPQDMKNESLDLHGQSRLAAKVTNREQAALQKETCQNVSENNVQKQTFLGLFQKPLESNDLMHAIQMHDATNNNSKQIVIEPRLEMHFDENSPQLSVSKNRKTQLFNESIDTSNVSTVWNKPSAAVQSIKELLLENVRLFSQSNLINPSIFDNKRSTLFFAEKDDSMDVSCTDTGPTDLESTPTKNKLSRIPQLIGSAKKLESLKKSMEFIQQELPNLGCNRRNQEVLEDVEEFSQDQDTPRRLSISIPKKLQELEESIDSIETPQKLIPCVPNETESPRKELRKLQESFDTIDIPRRVLSSVRKTSEKSEGDAIKFKEACNVDEIPRSTIDVNPTALQESFDTVEIPRRGTTFQRNDTLYICPNEIETTINASRKSVFQFEEAPITISDVSTFFTQKLIPNAKQAVAPYSLNTTEDLCKLNVNEIQALSRSPDSEDTTHNLAHFKKRYVELTCDSLALSDSRNDIEKTHLSLVNTFDDESEMIDCQQEIQVPVKISPPVKDQHIKPNSSVCRKCKCQRLSITQNDTTFGSFMSKQLPVHKIDLSNLEELAKKPNIWDVGKVWRQRIRESDSFNISDGSRSMAMNEEDSEEIEKLLEELRDTRLMNAKNRQQERKDIKIENSFVYKIRRKLKSKSNWIINDLLLFNNIILLKHCRIRTFAIVIYFTPKDPRGVEVTFDDIQLKPNKLHSHKWNPFEYALHYQLLVELPFDLKQICPTSDHFFDLLDHVDTVTEDVLRTGKALLSIVLPSPASLIREPSGRLYIRKYVRTKTLQNDVKRSEIHIEVQNLKKLSYESIAMPPLYEFDENIQLLPVGNDFLRIFLKDPLKYMKT